jgi:signal peptidase I
VSVFLARKSRDVWQDLLMGVLLASLMTVGFTRMVAEARFIPSPSMAPTLAVGDRLIVDKLSYRIVQPKRGDIVVFKPPSGALGPAMTIDAAVPWVKRLIGLPGDRVEIRHGVLVVNAQACREPYVPEPVAYEWPRHIVPKGHVFVLGDNRNQSVDGHIWGMLPQENILGRVRLRFWPLSRAGGLDTPLVAFNHGDTVSGHLALGASRASLSR